MKQFSITKVHSLAANYYRKSVAFEQPCAAPIFWLHKYLYEHIFVFAKILRLFIALRNPQLMQLPFTIYNKLCFRECINIIAIDISYLICHYENMPVQLLRFFSRKKIHFSDKKISFSSCSQNGLWVLVRAAPIHINGSRGVLNTPLYLFQITCVTLMT